MGAKSVTRRVGRWVPACVLGEGGLGGIRKRWSEATSKLPNRPSVGKQEDQRVRGDERDPERPGQIGDVLGWVHGEPRPRPGVDCEGARVAAGSEGSRRERERMSQTVRTGVDGRVAGSHGGCRDRGERGRPQGEREADIEAAMPVGGHQE